MHVLFKVQSLDELNVSHNANIPGSALAKLLITFKPRNLIMKVCDLNNRKINSLLENLGVSGQVLISLIEKVMNIVLYLI